MDCPACGVPLQRAEYEDAVVFQCPQCSGYLVHKRRLFLIKSSREHTPEMLQQEAVSQKRPDSDERIRCPRCKTARMQKELVRVGDDGEFHLDVCKECDHVWFDGGELARYQMSFERSSKAQDAESMERRQRMRTPEQQAEMAERMAELPPTQSFLVQGTHEMVLLALTGVLFVATIAFWWVEQLWASGAASLLFAGMVGWLLPRMLDTTRGQQAGLIILGVLEIVYLCYVTLSYSRWASGVASLLLTCAAGFLLLRMLDTTLGRVAGLAVLGIAEIAYLCFLIFGSAKLGVALAGATSCGCL